MLLHEAIIHVLQQNGRPMGTQDIANEINRQGFYVRKKDTLPVPQNQINARINQYRELFRQYSGNT